MRNLGLLVVVSLALTGGRFAHQGCGPEDFSGTYALLATGEVTVPGFPITGPFTRAGLVTADGRGNVEFTTASSYNGFIFYPSQFAGTYEVTPDCSITFSSVVPAPIDQLANIVGEIANNKKEVRFIIIEPFGQTVRATLTRQSKRHCTQRDLMGAYALDLSGHFQQSTVNDLAIAPEGFTRGGKLFADGWGNFRASTLVNYNGFDFQEEDFWGTYRVEKDCRVALRYWDADKGATIWWRGALAGNGSIVNLIDTEQCESVSEPEDPANWCNSGRIVSGQLVKK